MYNEGLDAELVSMKYRIQDLIVNYFKKSNKLDLLEYKFITDLDTLESLSYELNTQKEILKQLNKYHKETCKKCQFKILQTIKNIRSVTPNFPSHVRRKVAGRKNIRQMMNKKSVSPKFRELKMNENEKFGNISSILKDDDRTSFYSTSNNNLMQTQKKRNKMHKRIYNGKGKNNGVNRKLTPDSNYKLYNRNFYNYNYNRKSNVSNDKYKTNNLDKKLMRSKALSRDSNIKKQNVGNNIKRKNNYITTSFKSNNRIKKINNGEKNKKGKITDKNNGLNKIKLHKQNKTEYNLEDYQVIGDYIPRFPDEKDLEDDYFFFDNDKENKNKMNINNNKNEV